MKISSGRVTTTTNMQSTTKQEMTVDPRGFGKIMSMFSNQYSNRALAVVREYFCNGDDSRMTAGSARPTEVFLPTDLNPEILIRDYGTGLDKDELTTVFSTYTFSTKDDENNSTGGLGIGSKVAFTLGQQFTVTGFKDGVKTVVLFALNDKGVGEWDVRFEGPTEEPNGVLVSVGVPDVAAMRKAAEQFFLTVPKGRALVDGQPPAHLSDTVEFSRFNEEVMLVKDGRSSVRLQMGPVVYRVSSDILNAVAVRLDGLPSQAVAQSLANWGESNSVLMEVGVGDVDIAPSREDLIDTDLTVNRIASVVQGISDYIVNDVQRQIDAAPSRYAAMQTLHTALDDLRGFKVSKKAFTYGGVDKPFKNDVEVPLPTIFVTNRWTGRSYKITVAQDTKHTVDYNRAPKTLVITGIDAADTGKVKRYAKRFIEESEFEFIVMSPDTSGVFEWFEFGVDGGAATWTLDEYRAALRTMRDSNPRTKSEPSYSTGWRTSASRDLDDRDLLTDIISWGKDIVVFHDSSRVDSEISALLDENYTPVVLLGQQSENALYKRVEADGSVNIVSRHDVEAKAKAQIAADVKASIAPPTDDERVALGAAQWVQKNTQRRWTGNQYVIGIQNWVTDLIEATGGFPTLLNHPAIDSMLETQELAALLAADLTEDRKADLQRLQRWCGVEFEATEFEAEGTSVRALFPLFWDGFDLTDIKRNPAHRRAVIEYINSKA